MEARTGLVIGGMTAVAASIAVVTAVALANTAALADSPGASIASAHVVVPAAATPTATPQPTPVPTTTPDALAPSAEPEVVEAPAPVVVAPPESTTSQTPAAPATGPQVAEPAAPAVAGDIDSAIAAAKAAGTWEALRSWATAHGWSSGRIDALVARLQREIADQNEQQNLNGPHDSDTPWGSESEFPRGQQQSEGSQRPAHAGSNVGNGNGAWNDGKKDQSRNSPDERD